MPKLTIDDHQIDVRPGTKVIQAAEMLGIMIPRFCYHEALGAVGACRVCAVKFLEGPVKGIQMSCMVDAQDGMVVSTTDPDAMDFRAHVIEWLMLNHPHDCPVCDEGGHCLLQDMTVSGGHGIRQYQGKKRTYRDQFLGDLVQHEMNRCIHCYRCSRFYQEFSGYRDLGPMQIARRTYFGRAKDGALESPYSGNLIDICPTGVFTDKPARFKGRRWDFERSPSVCIHCSLGCGIVASARHREVVRIEAQPRDRVNGFFICDRGRFGFHYTNQATRPRRARVQDRETPMPEALAAAAERLGEVHRRSGPGSVACLCSPRTSVETLAVLKGLAGSLGWQPPVGFADPAEQRRTQTAATLLDPAVAISMREIENADCILAVGVDPVQEAPMLAMAMRQAWRKGAKVLVADPRPVSLPFPFEHAALKPGELDTFVADLIREAGDEASQPGKPGTVGSEAGAPSAAEAQLAWFAESLTQSRSPVVVCGTTVVTETLLRIAARAALTLKEKKGAAGIFYVLPESNSFGAAHFSSPDRTFDDLLREIEEGAVKALIVAECDPFHACPDPRRLESALQKLDLLIIADALPSRAAAFAHVLLPCATVFETRICFVNQEGRVQASTPVHRGGIPISQLTGGTHPPRSFRQDIPGGDPLPAWEILAWIGRGLSAPLDTDSYAGLWAWIVKTFPAFAGTGPDRAESGPALRMALPGSSRHPPDAGEERQRHETIDKGTSFELLVVDLTFGTEELSSYSPIMHKVEPAPFVCMHPEDAGRLQLDHCGRVQLALQGQPLELDLHLRKDMARGVLILPRHHRLPWDVIRPLPAAIPAADIQGVAGSSNMDSAPAGRRVP